MLQVAKMRSEIAPIFGVTPDSLRIKQQALYREASLQTYLPGQRAGKREGLRATAGATGLLVLCAMTSKNVAETGAEVVGKWEAPLADTGGVPAMKGLKLCGAGIILLLEHAQLRSHLDYLEVAQDVPEVAFVWKDGRRTVFAPPLPDAVEMTRFTRLPGKSLDKIAALIERDA